MNFNKAVFKCAYGLSKQLPHSTGPEIVFSGRSNVGKSSCINKLFNRKKLARVSCVPGKTATINFYDVEGIDFVDLPGYGYAKVSKSEQHRWSELIEGYFAQERSIALIVALVDMRHPISALDKLMIDFLIDHEYPFVVVMTKSDKLNKTEYASRLELCKKEIPFSHEIEVIPFSSETGHGLDRLHDVIAQALIPSCSDEADIVLP